MTIITTTNSIEGYEVVKHHGVVSAHVVEGTNALKDLASKISDVIGGRSGTLERTLQAADKKALNELTEQAEALGANAVVGVDLDYETIHIVGTMLMIIATGTAVTVRRSQKGRPLESGEGAGTGSPRAGETSGQSEFLNDELRQEGSTPPKGRVSFAGFDPGSGFKRR